jgi:predicted DNA-binding transcriptional regulator AlpA
MVRKTKSKTPAAAIADINLRDDCLLSTRQAASLVGLSAKTLRQLRCGRNGPQALKLGSGKQARCVYRRSDLERWISGNAHVVGGA